jgi:hypothetical protein
MANPIAVSQPSPQFEGEKIPIVWHSQTHAQTPGLHAVGIWSQAACSLHLATCGSAERRGVVVPFHVGRHGHGMPL